MTGVSESIFLLNIYLVGHLESFVLYRILRFYLLLANINFLTVISLVQVDGHVDASLEIVVTPYTLLSLFSRQSE